MTITWLTISQAADQLGVDQSTIRRWSDSGRLPAIRTPGGHRRYRVDDVAKLATPVARGEPVVGATPVARPPDNRPTPNPLEHQPEVAMALALLLDPTVGELVKFGIRSAIRQAVYQARDSVGRAA